MQRSLRASRISISLCFFNFGFIFATWASRIPDIQQKLNLSEAELGLVLLAAPAGSFITLPFSGYITSKIGSRKVVIISSLIYTSLLVCIGFSQNTWQLTWCLFLFGSSGNVVNIAINTQAIALETLYKKIIISSFHGMWSVAGLVAASLGTYLIGESFPVSYHFLLAAALSFCCVLLSYSYLLYENHQPQEKRPFFTKSRKGIYRPRYYCILLDDMPGRNVRLERSLLQKSSYYRNSVYWCGLYRIYDFNDNDPVHHRLADT